MKNTYYTWLVAIATIIVLTLAICSTHANNKEYETNVKYSRTVATTSGADSNVIESRTETTTKQTTRKKTETSTTTTKETTTTTAETFTKPIIVQNECAEYTEYQPEIITETTTAETTTYTEPETEITENSGYYTGTFEGTWYCAVDMGYTSTPYGSSGRTLVTGYSVASNYFPSGTILYIEGTGVTGTYRVDDTGGMSGNVVDFYYWDRSYVPASFLTAGRINIQVYVVG